MRNILCISDLHAPYQHPGAIDFLADLNRQYRPSVVVCIGDEVDAYALSQSPPDPDAPSAGAEIAAARRALQPLFRLFPRVLVCQSNHSDRPYRRARQVGLSADYLHSPGQVLEAPVGWTWMPYWVVDDVLFIHGDGLSGPHAAERAAQRHRRSTVIGHVHAFAGVAWSANRWSSIFGMNCGCLIDDSKPAFDYARRKVDRPTLGCGLILEGVPLFLPLGGELPGTHTSQPSLEEGRS